MKRFCLASVAALVILLAFSGSAFGQTRPEFKLGFKSLADQIPDVVGEPLESEHWGSNGDSLQRTSTGLMVWRKADNWTAFTNGARTWINGPSGVQDRLNGERFEWEAASPPTEVPRIAPQQAALTAPVLQPPAATELPAGPYVPDVRAMDPENAGPGATLKELILDVDKEWTGSWRWRPQKPVTVYLYSDSTRMFYDVERITGVPWPVEARQSRLGEEMFAAKDATTGGWAVLLAFKGGAWGLPGVQSTVKYNLLHGYSHVMAGDVGARDLPTWFFEGIAEYAGLVRDPGEVGPLGRVTAATALFNIEQHPDADPSTFPTLRGLSSSYWNCMVQSGEGNKRAVFGIAYLATKYLIDKVGTERVAQVVQATATGEGFATALQRITGYSVDQLDAEYRGRFSRAGWDSRYFTPPPPPPCSWDRTGELTSR